MPFSSQVWPQQGTHAVAKVNPSLSSTSQNSSTKQSSEFSTEFSSLKNAVYTLRTPSVSGKAKFPNNAITGGLTSVHSTDDKDFVGPYHFLPLDEQTASTKETNLLVPKEEQPSLKSGSIKLPNIDVFEKSTASPSSLPAGKKQVRFAAFPVPARAKIEDARVASTADNLPSENIRLTADKKRSNLKRVNPEVQPLRDSPADKKQVHFAAFPKIVKVPARAKIEDELAWSSWIDTCVTDFSQGMSSHMDEIVQQKPLAKEIKKFIATMKGGIKEKQEKRYAAVLYKHVKVKSKQALEAKKTELDIEIAAAKKLLDAKNLSDAETVKTFARLVKAKKDKDKLEEVDHFATAEGLIAAAKEVHSARNSAFKIAHYYRQKLLSDVEKRPIYRLLNNEDEKKVASRKYFDETARKIVLMGMGLDAIEENYRGLAAAEALTSHVAFESGQSLAPLLNNLVSGAAVESKKSVALKGGGAVGTIAGAKASLTGGVSSTKKTEFSIDNDTDLNYIRQYWLELTLGGKIKLLPLYATLSLSFSSIGRSDYFEEDGTRKGIEKGIRYAAVRENNRNWIMRGRLRTNRAALKVYSAGRRFRNFFRWVCSKPEKNPRFAFYATSKALTNAHGTEAILIDISKQIDTVNAGKFAFSEQFQGVRNVAKLEQLLDEAAPLSQPGVRSQVNAPQASLYPTLGSKLGVAVGPGVTTKLVASGIEKIWESYIPSADASVTAKGEMGLSKINLQKLELSHQTASTKRTASLEQSRKLMDDVLAKIWDKKSNGQHENLPAGLKEARDIYKKPISPIKDAQEAAVLIQGFTNTVQLLEGRLLDLESNAALFIKSAKHAKKDASLEEMYGELFKKVKSHQYLADRLKKGEQFSERGARYALLRILASYDTAAGLVEIGMTSLLQQLPPDLLKNTEVEKALRQFDSSYLEYTRQLKNSNQYIPVTKEELARVSELHSLADSAKFIAKGSGEAKAGVTKPTVFGDTSVMTENTYKDGELDIPGGTYLIGQDTFLGGRVKKEKTFVKQLSHPNPWRLGTFSTKEWNLSASGLGAIFMSAVLASKKVKKGLAKLENTLLPHVLEEVTPPEKGNMAQELVLSALGIAEKTPSLSVVEGKRNGIQQYQRILRSATRGSSVETPNLLEAKGGSLTASVSSQHTVTQALTLIGPDLAYNVLQYSRLQQNGVTDDVQVSLSKPFNSKNEDLRASLEPLFENLEKNRSLSLAYFGLNAINSVLSQFTETNLFASTRHTSNGNLQLENGFEIYHRDVREEFSQMANAMNKTVEKRAELRREVKAAEENLRKFEVLDIRNKVQAISAEKGSPTSGVYSEPRVKRRLNATEEVRNKRAAAETRLSQAQAAYINSLDSATSKDRAEMKGTLTFDELTQLQSQIKDSLNTPVTKVLSTDDKLLKRFKYPSKVTVKEFLELATPQEKKVFYQDRKEGLRLFASYVVLVGDAQKVADVFKSTVAYQRTVSLFNQENATAGGKPSLHHRFANHLKNMPNRVFNRLPAKSE